MKVVERRTVREERVHVVLFGDDLREYLANSGKFPHGVPAQAKVYIEIPGGGDWSNQRLDIYDHPIHVEWTTTDEEAPPARENDE